MAAHAPTSGRRSRATLICSGRMLAARRKNGHRIKLIVGALCHSGTGRALAARHNSSAPSGGGRRAKTIANKQRAGDRSHLIFVSWSRRFRPQARSRAPVCRLHCRGRAAKRAKQLRDEIKGTCAPACQLHKMQISSSASSLICGRWPNARPCAPAQGARKASSRPKAGTCALTCDLRAPELRKRGAELRWAGEKAPVWRTTILIMPGQTGRRRAN